MELTSSVVSLPGIGESTAGKLDNLGITTIFDFLYHIPFRYEDRSLISPIGHIQAGETITVIGKIDSLKNDYTRSGKIIQSGQISDDTGTVAVIWFNQPFLAKSLRAGQSVALYGRVDFYKNKPALIAPEYELLRPRLLHMGRIVPIYPETSGLSSKWLRNKMDQLLHALPVSEILPDSHGLPSWKNALDEIHFPSSLDSIPRSKKRLSFDELFLLQLRGKKLRTFWEQTQLAHPLIVDSQKVSDFISSLPFTLTGSQKKAIAAILVDLTLTRPANRLLEGDVGSGKTVVAAVAALVSHLNSFETIFMAPTQILASQHYQTLTELFRPFHIPIHLITGTVRTKKTTDNIPGIMVGTHALISEKNRDLFGNVGLVIIDEQHRFGVSQRSLAATLGKSPHTLTMTATPIPRTIALTMFGDLDLTLLDDKPPGRLPIKTWLVPEEKRLASYSWISKELSTNGSQLIYVCPFIDDSESMSTIKAARTEYDKLVGIFPQFKVGLLHGKLKSKEKDEVINKFRAGEYHILVATPVVEVGIDIPNAHIIVIEGADRFGLAQLHQLRGRVGRSSAQSYCLLFSSEEKSAPRLKAMEQYSSGLKLAEVDLQLRGPGEIYGTSQHGFPDFKVADYSDIDLIDLAKKSAESVYPKLKEYPILLDLLKEDKITLIKPN